MFGHIAIFEGRTDKKQSNLEFMLRFQQYIELVRTGEPSKMVDAINHARKYLMSSQAAHPKEVAQAGVLLCFPPNTRVPEIAVCLI